MLMTSLGTQLSPIFVANIDASIKMFRDRTLDARRPFTVRWYLIDGAVINNLNDIFKLNRIKFV